MGKKKAIQIFKGSLKTHWIRYVTNFNMHVNPAHMYATNMSMQMLAMLATIDAKYLQPGFSHNTEILRNATHSTPSILHLKLVNGVERKYDMQCNPFSHIKEEILYINKMVEFERSLAGQDDELEDEA